MGKTNIEWADQVWNPVTGCTPISEGCANCWAKRRAETRLRGRFGYPQDEPFRPGTFHPNKLDEPYHYRKPKKFFVVSMGDLFHEAVRQKTIANVFDIAYRSYIQYGHTFIFLTKRPQRMNDEILLWSAARGISIRAVDGFWLGVTAENQRTADERIPILLQISAAVRFVSCEPLLSDLDLLRYLPGGKANERYGEGISCTDRSGAIYSSGGRNYLEDGANGGRESIREPFVFSAISQTSKSGDKRKDRLSDGDVFPRRTTTLNGGRTQNCVDSNQPQGYSDRDGDKSQGRQQKKPSPRQSGDSDTTAKCDAFNTRPRAEEKSSIRGSECLRQTHEFTGIGNSASVLDKSNDTRRDSESVQCRPGHCIGNPLSKIMGSPSINWVIAGPETGPRARPTSIDWVRDLQQQCAAASVPFFDKRDVLGETLQEWPQ